MYVDISLLDMNVRKLLPLNRMCIKGRRKYEVNTSYTLLGVMWVQMHPHLLITLRLNSFGAESFIFQVAIQKFKDQDIHNYKFCLLFCMGVKLGR